MCICPFSAGLGKEPVWADRREPETESRSQVVARGSLQTGPSNKTRKGWCDSTWRNHPSQMVPVNISHTQRNSRKLREEDQQQKQLRPAGFPLEMIGGSYQLRLFAAAWLLAVARFRTSWAAELKRSVWKLLFGTEDVKVLTDNLLTPPSGLQHTQQRNSEKLLRTLSLSLGAGGATNRGCCDTEHSSISWLFSTSGCGSAASQVW